MIHTELSLVVKICGKAGVLLKVDFIPGMENQLVS